jgi:2-methylisocitrate lyase-like PEP mutase family enzyme
VTNDSIPDRSEQFRALHVPGRPLLLPNPWDAGTARVLASLGFAALATTSSGFAATLGRADGAITRDEALEHARAVVEASDLPVSADLENGFAHEPEQVAQTIALAAAVGLAGASIEDYTGDDADPIYDVGPAVERVAAAATAAHSGQRRTVLTARAENYLHGREDLADTIDRLLRYQDAGADVVYAPGLVRAQDIAAVVSAVSVPVNVLAGSNSPPVALLADLGVSRISVGGAFAYAALGALVRAGREFLEAGTYGYSELGAVGRAAARAAFG